MYYYHPMMYGQDWGWGLAMGLLWLMFMLAVVIIVVRLLRGHNHTLGHKSDPLTIAKERYASGEITKAEFDQIKKDIA